MGLTKTKKKQPQNTLQHPASKTLKKTFREATACMGSFGAWRRPNFETRGPMMFFKTCLETDAQVLTQVLPRWLHRRNRRESVKCLMNPMTVAQWTKSWGFVGDARTRTADQRTVKRAKSVLETSIPTDHFRGRTHVLPRRGRASLGDVASDAR